MHQQLNLPRWDWKYNMLTSNTSHTDLHYKLGEILNNGLLHMVEKPTRENNTLNLIITNNLTLP